jgi:sigma-B regulation protein RsbU (phosphoserine phosphatase)
MGSLAEQCALALGNRQMQQEAKEKDRLEAELRTASEIQRILLPDKAPEMPGFQIAGKNIPARHVSGDYYDFFPVGDKHVGMVIADVSGKGVPASLITAMCRSVLRANARESLSPAAVLSTVNRHLFPDIREDMFISMIYAVLARDGSSLALARAGHTDPLLWRKRDGKVEVISAPGVAVGFDKGDVFDRVTKDVTVKMDPGDCLLLYTDGVNEATDHKGLLFGEEKIHEILAKTAPEGATEVVEGLTQAVGQFMGGDPQQDDITLIAVKRNF